MPADDPLDSSTAKTDSNFDEHAEPKPAPRRASKPASERKRAAARRNLEKAWAASRAHWEKTPARMAASRRNIQSAQAAIRERPRRLSPAQLDAARRNVANARAALARRGRTPEHLAKLRETIRLARAARTRSSLDLHNIKILRHGAYALSVRATMKALGEDTARLDQRIRLLRGFLAAEGPLEESLIRAIAEMLWRRERLCYAQAEWESRRIDALLTAAFAAPAGYTFSTDEMIMRAHGLLEALMDVDKFDTREWHMQGSIKRLLRRLLRSSLGREPDFHP